MCVLLFLREPCNFLDQISNQSISSLCCRKRVEIFIDVADGTFYSLQYDSPTIPSDLWRRTLSEAARVLADEEFFV
jgi:hypothetical protein